MDPCTASMLIALYHHSTFLLVFCAFFFQSSCLLFLYLQPLFLERKLICFVEADEEEQCGCAGFVRPVLCGPRRSAAAPNYHQFTCFAPETSPSFRLRGETKSSSLFQQLVRSAPLLFCAFKKPLLQNIKYGICSV